MAYQTHVIDGYTVLKGKNAKGNWNILDMSDSFDIWFHVEHHPSAHCILRTFDDIDDISISTIHNISLLLKEKDRKERSKTTVIYCEVGNVKKGKQLGSVITNPSVLRRMIV